GWADGAHVGVSRAERGPIRRRPVILLLEVRREADDGVAVVELAARLGVANSHQQVAVGVERWPRRRPDGALALSWDAVAQHVARTRACRRAHHPAFVRPAIAEVAAEGD